MSFTIGSLFDGSGGFPLAATMCGGTPKWASEVEPFPIAVTWSRFTKMKHLGSVTDIKGYEVEPVDVITFGSPCQDLSVAGKRAGLKHEANGDDETTRSGLFMEAVRIIKEMREATNGVYPRFALWENVPGAFSSNKGEDFRTVLEELIKIVEPTAVMPEVPKNGWPYADSYCGDGWSLAYRVLDAQFWGVPQRRRRIYLVADFRGECAGKVSFECEGLRGYFAESGTSWQAAPGDAEDGSGAADCERDYIRDYPIIYTRGYGGNVTLDGVSPTLEARAGTGGNNQPIVAYSIDPLSSNSMKSSNPHSGFHQTEIARTLDTFDPNPCKNQGGIAICERLILDDQGGSQISVRDDGKCPTLRAEAHGNLPCVLKEQHLFENHSQDSQYKGPLEVSPMLPAQLGTGGNNQPFVIEETPVFSLQGAGATSQNSQGMGHKTDVMFTLNTTDVHGVAFQTYQKVTGPLMANSHPGSYTGQDAFSDMLVAGVDCRNGREYPELNGTLQAKPNGGFSLNCNQIVRVRYVVRRLTPTECARLQGFPDKWGHPNWMDENTKGETAEFWRTVYLTDCAIKEKKPKPRITDKQDGWEVAVIRWYNSLHTDSSEYKMWGNGIALPNALYMMQGIADVMSEEKAARRKWLKDLLGDCL